MNLDRIVPDRIRSQYSLKIATALGLVFVVTLVSASFFHANVAGELGAAADASLTDHAEDGAAVAGLWAEANTDLAASIASTRAVQSGDPERVGDYLSAVAARSDRVAAVHYVDTSDGTVAASSQPAAVGESPSVSVPEEGVAVGDPTAAVGGDGTVLPFVAPAGENHAVVVAGSAADLGRRLDGGQYATALVAGEEVVASAEGGQGAATADLSAVGTVETATVDGEELTATAAAVPGTAWRVVGHAPTGTVYSERDTATAAVVALVYIVALNIGIFGITVGGNLALSLRQLAEKATEIGEGDLDMALSTGRIDEVGVLYAEFDSMRTSLKDSLEEAEQARTEAERAREAAEQSELETQRLNEELEAEAQRYGEVMAACAEGDLTRRLDPQSNSDAMAAIATAFNEMIADLERTIADVEDFADKVAEASVGLDNSAAEVRESSSEVSDSVEQISQGARSQTGTLQTASDEVNDLSAAVEEVAATTDEVAGESDRVAELGAEGRDHAEETIAEMHEMERQTQQAVAAIERLADQIADIDEATELIDDIAEQTAILALNANIEAARAGGGSEEAGEGFAVVADQVKDLAAETQRVVEEIQEQVEAVRTQATESAADIRTAESHITGGVETVEALTEDLASIVDGVESVDTGLKSIAETTDQQAESAQEIVTTVDEVASVSEETTRQADTVATAATETTDAIDDVSAAATRLAENTRDLQEMLDAFELDADGSTRRPAAADGGTTE